MSTSRQSSRKNRRKFTRARFERRGKVFNYRPLRHQIKIELAQDWKGQDERRSVALTEHGEIIPS